MIPTQSQPAHTLPEGIVEAVIFASRWLLAPIYVGLGAGLIVLLIKFVQRAVELLTHVLTTDGDAAIIGILSLIDLSLMGSLVLSNTSATANWPGMSVST